MNNILIFSQSGNETMFAKGLCIGKRQPNLLIGEKLKEVMEEQNVSTDTLITHFGNNYKDTIKRVLNDEEIPKPKFVEKLTNLLNLSSDYFADKELENVLITTEGIVVAKYETNDRALEVKKELDKEIEEKYIKGLPIVIKFPTE
ncbi:MAG: hypothetical protein J6T15_03795 [Bacilli bacterium]|nr:hypothetical protein [Bacilli bacterium]